MEPEDLQGGLEDQIVIEFNMYEDYLDKQITSTDLFYLEDME